MAVFMVVALPGHVGAQDETAPVEPARFTIREFMPVVAPEMLDVRQMYVGAHDRIHASDLIPGKKGGITRTRMAVRSSGKASTSLTLVDTEPSYRAYQILSRGLMVPSFVPTLSWAGAEHILLGTVTLGGYTFESDPSFPLHFKLVRDVGYVYLCGRGTVTTKKGGKHTLGQNQELLRFIDDLKAEEQLSREAAAESLGWLAVTREDIDQALPALLSALKDDAMEVRRNAAAALGRIGDPRAQEGLSAAAQDEDEWVREVIVDALNRIKPQKTP
jgi:hypothetical protein